MKKVKIVAIIIIALSTMSLLYAQRSGHGGGGYHGGGRAHHGAGYGFNHNGYAMRPYIGVSTGPIGYGSYGYYGYGNNCGYGGYWHQWRCW